jgi:hypothetical protein
MYQELVFVNRKGEQYWPGKFPYKWNKEYGEEKYIVLYAISKRFIFK